jgi:anaerobic magnesium-protoporphyrin IX monomethyl ester cyclase
MHKTKVVLIHPPLKNLVLGATPEYVDENRGVTPPMGLLYLQSAIEHSRHESVFLDANLEGWDHEKAAEQVLSYKPDIIGLQAMTFTLPDAYLLAKEIKRIDPKVKIIIGGPHATIYPKETAGLDAVDFAFAGEGEVDFISFLDVFTDLDARSKIPGIAYKINGGVSYTTCRGLLQDLDSVNYPARKSSKYAQYSSVLAKRNPITVMITSRGCPFQCVFCNRMGRKYRYHSAGYVLGEIDEIVKLGIKEIFIHDDTFTLKRERVMEICQGFIARKADIVWEARTRVDCVDEEMLALMRKAGCIRLSFGVESGSEKVLKSMRKAIEPALVEKVFKWCRKEGILTLADFMFGNLDEEMDDIKKSIDLSKRINPDFVQYSICSPYPDTPLYKMGLENGLITHDLWLEFAKDPLCKFNSPVWTQHFSEEELKKITTAAYKAFYMNPRFILKQLARINSLTQLKIMLRSAFGMLKG